MVIHRLANWNADAVQTYKWRYSWPELKRLYIGKQQEYAELKQIDYQFLVELASAALGGGKKEGDYGVLEDDAFDELTEEQEKQWREVLGDAEFERKFGA
jgi:hypothetical protein